MRIKSREAQERRHGGHSRIKLARSGSLSLREHQRFRKGKFKLLCISEHTIAMALIADKPNACLKLYGALYLTTRTHARLWSNSGDARFAYAGPPQTSSMSGKG